MKVWEHQAFTIICWPNTWPNQNKNTGENNAKKNTRTAKRIFFQKYNSISKKLEPVRQAKNTVVFPPLRHIFLTFWGN